MEDKYQHDDENDTRTCANCQGELRLGDDCILVQPGVIGPRGFVPLDEGLCLCNHVCAEQHFNGNDHPPEKLPRRVP